MPTSLLQSTLAVVTVSYSCDTTPPVTWFGTDDGAVSGENARRHSCGFLVERVAEAAVGVEHPGHVRDLGIEPGLAPRFSTVNGATSKVRLDLVAEAEHANGA